MNTPVPHLPFSPSLLLALIVAALVSLALGAIAGTFSLIGTVLASIVFGLGAVVAIGMKGGNTTTASVAHLAVSVGIICVPLGAVVTVLVQ